MKFKHNTGRMILDILVEERGRGESDDDEVSMEMDAAPLDLKTKCNHWKRSSDLWRASAMEAIEVKFIMDTIAKKQTLLLEFVNPDNLSVTLKVAISCISLLAKIIIFIHVIKIVGNRVK